MIEWITPNLGEFRKVLLKFYPSNQKLQRFACDNFDCSLEDLPETKGTPRSDWADALLEQAAARGWVDELYVKFCSDHPSDPRVHQLRHALNDPVLEQAIGEPHSSNAIVRSEVENALAEDPFSAHLVIAIFWQERQKQKIRIHPKLCYRNSEQNGITQESLIKDDCSISLKDFPALFKKLVDFTISRLSRLFSDPRHPWKLAIELFVPVDLISQPLSTWCGRSEEALISRSIVIGCSDRFDPDRQAEAHDLYNQLKFGWQRFQDKAPDQIGATLKNLFWLTSDTVNQEVLEEYSGFKCYGDWLKPDEQFLDNWKDLVRSGIPLALWMCEGQPQRPDIERVFDALTNGTRLKLLEQISLVRKRQRKTCNYCVGVFYENPSYLPDLPLPKEEQFFAWPGT